MNRFHMIIIDDSTDDFEMYTRLINKPYPSATFTHISSSNKAFQLFQHEQPDCDLLLLDYHMPGQDGLQLLKTLRIHNISINAPIIVLTGQGDENIAVDFMKEDVEHYINKNDLTEHALKKIIKESKKSFEQKKLEQDIQKERLSFAYTLAHDLQNPVKRIQKYCEFTKKYPQNFKKYLNHIENDTQFVIDFIHQLLVYTEAGRSCAEKETVSLQEVLQKSLENLSVQIDKKGASVHLYGDFPHVQGAKIPLIQLFQNLVGNSIKYCSTKPEINIESTLESDHAYISIKDNGIGIKKSIQHNIFQPFFRLPFDNETSHGLGLSIVKTIVDQHHASIDVTSPKNGGTQFDLRFPLSWQPM